MYSGLSRCMRALRAAARRCFAGGRIDESGGLRGSRMGSSVVGRVGALQFFGRAELHADLLTGGITRRILTGPRFREHW